MSIMFGLFKSWDERCLAEAKNLYGNDEKAVEKWLLAFGSEITEARENGERNPDFCVAWVATGHLHKMAKTDVPQDKNMASFCEVNTDNDLINKVTIKICEAASENMHYEMKEGVLRSLKIINKNADT